MISDRTLTLAIERQVITAAQASELRLLASSEAAAEPHDDEKLRFITGFGDLFVSIGLVLFLGATAFFIGRASNAAIMFGAAAVESWLLAEFFVRRRRMALPSIILLVAFAGAVFGCAGMCAVQVLEGKSTLSSSDALADPSLARAAIFAALVTVLAAVVHYRRFRVPITVAAGVAALILALIGVLAITSLDFLVAWYRTILFVCGLLVFALAMRIDMSDPLRATRRTDIAFWLHFLAAPMIVHPLIGGFVWRLDRFDQTKAVEVLLIFVGLAVVAIAVDRRAILVSGLAYAGTACATLLNRLQFIGSTAAATLLVLGAFVLLLSAGWRPLRRLFLSLLPPAVARRLPNPSAAYSA